MKSGGQCVMIYGILAMPTWSVNSWALQILVSEVKAHFGNINSPIFSP